MNIAHKKSMHYKSNFLTRVIFRIDYNQINRLQTEKKPDISKAIEAKYPFTKGMPTTQFNINLSNTGAGLDQQDTGFVWEHRSDEKSKKVFAIAPTHLTLDYGKSQYDHYPLFREEVKYIYDNFINIYKINDISRIGLRFVNVITLKEGNPLDWGGIINEKLAISSIAGQLEGMKITRTMHQLHALYDDISVLFNYGIFNRDYPNPIARREFILDYDCYITGGIPATDTLNRLDDLNRVAENAFENSIERGLRDIMEVIDE